MFAKVKERIEAGTRPGNGTSTGNAAGHAGTEKKPMPSIISRDMVITGDLDTPGEVHVEGSIRGDVRCARLIIGATGNVQGHIFATTVRIHGSVQGEINAEEVFLLNGSDVSGDVIQTMLEIAPGAAFEGAVRRRGSDATPRMLAAPVELPEAKAGEAATPVEPLAPEPEMAESVPSDVTAAVPAPVEDKDPAADMSSPINTPDRPPQG